MLRRYFTLARIDIAQDKTMITRCPAQRTRETAEFFPHVAHGAFAQSPNIGMVRTIAHLRTIVSFSDQILTPAISREPARTNAPMTVSIASLTLG